MSGTTFEAFAQSICLSGAIDYELTHEAKAEASTFPIAVTFNAYPEAFDDTLSVAIAFEIERTYKTAAMSIIDVDDKCLRLTATLSDDEDIKATDHPVARPVTKGSGIYKKAQRSRYEKKRPYTWRQPLKNKGGLPSKRLPAGKRNNEKANANAKAGLDEHEETSQSLERDGDLLEDDFNIDGLFEEPEEEEVVMLDGETEDEADTDEPYKGDLFVAKKQSRTTPRATTRQLAILVRKNMCKLYKLADNNLGKPERIYGDQYTLRGAVDKIKNDRAGELSAEELVSLHEAIDQIEHNQLVVDV